MSKKDPALKIFIACVVAFFASTYAISNGIQPEFSQVVLSCAIFVGIFAGIAYIAKEWM